MGKSEQNLTWRLSDPGMGLLERAGLAALYMTLRAADEQRKKLSPLRWDESDIISDAVTVRWAGPAKSAFIALFEFAWQVREGVLYLPGVHRNSKLRDHYHLRVALHNGITRTFLQHPRVQPKGELVKQIVRLDDDREIDVAFQPLEATKLKPTGDLKTSGFFDRKGNLCEQYVCLSGWVYPGIAGRYGDEEAWSGPAKLGLLLMLSPISCLYQQLHSERGTWLFVVPDISNLEEFDNRRQLLRLDPSYTDVASPSDAGMQFLADFCWQPNRIELNAACQVVAMGKVGYYQSQSIRKGVVDVSPTRLSLNRYRILHRELDNRYVRRKVDGDDVVSTGNGVKSKRKSKKAKKLQEQEPIAVGWFSVPSGRGRIADNLIEGRPWYADLFEPLPWDFKALDNQRKRNPGTSIERLWFQNLTYQRGKLMKLVQEKDMWDSEGERLFVEAFWEILAALYKREADAVGRGGSRKADERLEDLNEDIRRRLTRAKTRDLLRETAADLIAKPVEKYRSPLVRQRPDVIWSLINDPYEWKRARDLALLALASYMNKDKRAAATTGAPLSADSETNNEGE